MCTLALVVEPGAIIEMTQISKTPEKKLRELKQDLLMSPLRSDTKDIP